MKQKRAYKFRFYPTNEQKQILAQTFGCARYIYNWGLRLRTDAYYQEQRRLYYSDTSAMLTVLKKQESHAWLNDVSCVPVQQALRHLDKAFRNFFEGKSKYPTFKKKRNRQCAEYTTSAFTWQDGTLSLAKMADLLNIVWSRRLPENAKPTTVTVTKDASDRYFVSILIEEDIAHLEPGEQTVGTDLGLKDCGIVHDRDVNAALNIRSVGLTVLNACGEAVRPGRVKSRAGKPQ